MNQVWLALVLVVSHSAVSVSSKTIVRQANEDYMSFGIISFGEDHASPKCVVCGEKLTKLKKQTIPLTKSLQEKKKIKSHTTAESESLPTICKRVNIMFGQEYGKEILKIPMSDNTISQHIQDMSQDVQSQAIANIKEADIFVIQLNEGSDVTGKAQLLAFSSFHDLSWKPCISICTDGAPSVSGSLKGFEVLAKKKNPGVDFTQVPAQRDPHFIINSILGPKVLDETSKWLTIPTAHGSEVAISRVVAFKVLYK
ncbi:protein ZBED8-like [Cryptotermes secundus]|uniref:protein ZBED8-like n=1 Tax=Cryptotermes secundus TaxID=105785 RepID=UPI000CD7C786|nr:protein ZBED8-like [Cryptotermes secundus]